MKVRVSSVAEIPQNLWRPNRRECLKHAVNHPLHMLRTCILICDNMDVELKDISNGKENRRQ